MQIDVSPVDRCSRRVASRLLHMRRSLNFSFSATMIQR